MKKNIWLLLAGIFSTALLGQEGLIPAFQLETSPLELSRLAQPATPFDKAGPKFAILGTESGTFEAWAYPLKLLRNFTFSFFIGSSTRPIPAAEIVRRIAVTPEATVLTYTFQSFSVRAVFIVARSEPGALILLEVDSSEPLKIVCGFLPVLQPMWPAGIGGQYAYWDDKVKAYVISESSRRNHGLVGSPAAMGMSYTPAHMLSDFPSEFAVEIPDPSKLRGKFIPFAVAGGRGKREDAVSVYRRLLADPRKYYQENIDHFRQLHERTLRIETPVAEINQAFEWAKVAFSGLMVDNPDLGSGIVAGLGMSGTSGRPGFGWFFGGDAFINSFSLNAYGALADVRRVLAFTQKWQRADGKMAHELSQAAAYIDWFKDYPYAYIHADTTPFYIVAMADYFHRSGDTAFLKQSWPSLRRAYDWCLSTDANRDGLMDNKKAGLGGVEYGELTDIETDIYLAAVWIQAAKAMAAMAEARGDAKTNLRAWQAWDRASRAFGEKFWDEGLGFYVFGFNSKGEKVRELSPMAAVALMWSLGDRERSRRTCEKMCGADLMTDWGIRSISRQSRFYEPQNYNYGAVWPWSNGWVAAALFAHGLHLQGYNLLLATARHTFDNNLGAITEVFSGDRNIWPQEAVSHQGFSSAGFVLPLVRGLFGLEADAGRKQLVFAPQFPADWGCVKLDNWRIGSAVFSLEYSRSLRTFSEKGTVDLVRIILKNKGGRDFSARLAPWFSAGCRVQHVTLDGREVPFDMEAIGQVVRPSVVVPVGTGAVVMEIELSPSVEILPTAWPSRTGDGDRGMKIVSVSDQDDRLQVTAWGLSGQTYSLGVTNPNLVKKVIGARLNEEGMISITFPSGSPGVFVEWVFSIETR